MMPDNVQTCLLDLERHYRMILGDNLHGMVVHGSLAMGCYNPESSDIDVLVTVHEPLALIEKQQLGAAHLELSEEHQQNIEISVVLITMLDEFIYPTPFEFHYSDDHKQDFIDGTADLTTQRTDPDLAAHFMITKHHGVTRYGQIAQDIYPDIPASDYLDSIAQDAQSCYNNIMGGADEGLCAVPPYAVLNLCRVVAYIQAQQITSKQSGGEWGMAYLPEPYHDVIQAALDEYEETGSSQAINCEALKAFASYTFNIIQTAWKNTPM